MGAPSVVILANKDDPDSVKIAEHYAAARHIPADRIVALPMPLAEQITWREFVLGIHRPLLKAMLDHGWIDGIPMETEDAIGRRKFAFNALKIDALVVCRGVPLKIANDPELADAGNLPAKAPAGFRSNAAAVDSELALLALSGTPVDGMLPNPRYVGATANPLMASAIIPVGRLDGPTPADAMALVDRAIEAESKGLIGRAYVDIGGPHAQGDDWLRQTAAVLKTIGFPPEVESTRAPFASIARFDRPVFYFGWYANAINGPMRDRNFRFPPGAIALHIYSFSASTMRNGNGPWAPSLVARGVTLTFGNVNEPYLQFTHQPQLFLKALIDGKPAGEAALDSLNALSWQAILIGDPLYRPFARPFEKQWADREKLSPALAPYVYLRRIALLDQANETEQASMLARSALRKVPSLPLVVSLAERQMEAKQPDSAQKTLAIIPRLPNWRTKDIPMLVAGAQILAQAGAAPEAVKWYQRILTDSKLEKDARKQILKIAQPAARTALDFTQASRWEEELQALNPPPPPPPPASPADKK